ncbi:MAG TPA: AsmA-like C-terminal region-containing protein [Longimicrobiales bacterium]|nr:AsmA-like C-terminal region-containing protein [Longimicrobiales bacterium]
MTRHRRILVLAGSALAVLLVVFVVVPALFEGPVEARVRAEIERATRVRVSWSDVGLGLLRDFPQATLSLSDLAVLGTGTFDGDTLAAVRRFRLTLDLRSVLGAIRGSGPLVVRSVRLDEPAIRLQVDEDGTTSWDILRARSEADSTESAEGAGKDVAISLRSLELTDGRVLLENRRADLFVSLEGLTQSLRGDFSRDSLVASTRTHADVATVRFAGTPYLPGVALDFTADLDVRGGEGRVRLLDNELHLNELVLRWSGDVAKQGEDVALDLAFEAPSTDLAQILSLVPAFAERNLAALETSGSLSVIGEVRGTYGKTAFPAFTLTAAIDGGAVRGPGLPVAASDLAADLSIDNPGGDLDSTVVSLSRFHVELDEQPLDVALTLRTPVSDPDVDVRVRGTIDLADVAGTLALEGAEDLTGVVVADAAMRARRSDVDSARWDRIEAEGTVSAQGVTLQGPELAQPVTVEEALLELSPERVRLDGFRARLGSSDLQATGRLDNLLGFVLRDAPLRGTASFTSERFVLDEWKSDETRGAIAVPAMLDLTLDGAVERLEYGELVMSAARGRLRVQDRRVTLEGFSLETLGGRVGLEGYYETLNPERPAFSLSLALDSLDVASASEALPTVQAFAPVARYAQGSFSADLDLSGALGEDMTPVLDVLDGTGALSTSRIALEGFPPLDRLSEMLDLAELARPTVSAIRSSLRIEDGRLHVAPFSVGVGGLAMTVSGSNGIDQSLDYTLALALPSGALGEAAAVTVRDLAARAGLSALDLDAADSVHLAVRVGGTVTEPEVGVGLAQPGASLRERAGQAAAAEAARRVEEAQERLEAEREEARRRARERADSLVAQAEARAQEIREEAARLAEQVRAEGNRAADEVLARATNPLARAAAEPVAARLRQEAEDRAAQIEREADERARALVDEARTQADALVGAS